MARFTDFNKFLNKQEDLQKTELDIHGQKIQQSRKKYDAFIKDVFKIVKDYYDEIIYPREKMHIILKKDENFLQKLQKGNAAEPFYTYLINFVPKKLFSLAFDPNYVIEKSYLFQNELTTSDWHPNVALQFELSLFDVWDNSKEKFTGNLLPHICIRVWGEIKNSKNLIDKNLQIIHQKAWHHPYLELILKIEDNLNPEKEIERLLMIIAPNVLFHRKEVFGLD